MYLCMLTHSVSLSLCLPADATYSEPFETHLRGPGFVMEPPGRVEFSNSSGGWLDCSASGSPQPTIDWVHADGTAVTEIHGVRRVLRNGTLVLMPFAAAAYHQDIHNTIYRCIASNSVGRIVSRDVQVRAGKSATQSYIVYIFIYICMFFIKIYSLFSLHFCGSCGAGLQSGCGGIIRVARLHRHFALCGAHVCQGIGTSGLMGS